jgi:hypothetical protein
MAFSKNFGGNREFDSNVRPEPPALPAADSDRRQALWSHLIICSSDGMIEGSSDAILCHPRSLKSKFQREHFFRTRMSFLKGGGSMAQCTSVNML